MEVVIYKTAEGTVIEYPEWMSDREALERAYWILKQR